MYMKFKDRQNKSMVREVRLQCPPGEGWGFDWEGRMRNLFRFWKCSISGPVW